MNIFVIPDIHGEYEKLCNLLKLIDKEKTDKDYIVFLGDYIDRGAMSKEVINKVLGYKLDNPDKVITLIGNHDQQFYDIMNDLGKIQSGHLEWLNAYCMETLDSYGLDTDILIHEPLDNEYVINTMKTWLKELSETEDYKNFKQLMSLSTYHYILGKYVFSHSGGVSYKSIHQHSIMEWLWSRDFQKRDDGYIRVFGHTPTHNAEIIYSNDLIHCDVGAVFRDISLPLIILPYQEYKDA